MTRQPGRPPLSSTSSKADTGSPAPFARRQQERRAADRRRGAAHRASGHAGERAAHPRHRDAGRAGALGRRRRPSGRERNTLAIHAKAIRAADSIRCCARGSAPRSCWPRRCSPAAARSMLPPPGGDVIGRRRLDTHFLALEQLGASVTARRPIAVHDAAASSAPTSSSTSRA